MYVSLAHLANYDLSCLFFDKYQTLLLCLPLPDSMPRIVSQSVSMPVSQVLDASAVNSASRWWSGILQVPPADAGSIVRLRFQCRGFDVTYDTLKIYGQGDTSTSSALCNPLCPSTTSVTVCEMQGPSKVQDRLSFFRLLWPTLIADENSSSFA